MMMELKTEALWEGRVSVYKTEDGKLIFLTSSQPAPEVAGSGCGMPYPVPEISVVVPGVSAGMPGDSPGTFAGPPEGIPGAAGGMAGERPGTSGRMPGNISGISGETVGNVPGTSRGQGNVPFAEYAEKWLAAIKGNVKESTYMKYRNQLDSYILPGLGEREWATLSRDVTEGFCRDLLFFGGKKRKGLSQKTVSDIMSVVRSIFRYAAENGAKGTFVISGVTVKKGQTEMKVLAKEEQDRLYRHLLAHPTPKNLGILICLLMGLRLGEVCALKWEDISFPDQTLFVHRTVQRVQTKDDPGKKTKVIFTPPKSASSVRRIPIPKELMKLLPALRKSPDSYILTGSQGSFVEPRAMERHFEKILKELEIRHVKFHVLRHTFATNCVESGFDVKTLSEILGHSSVSITLNCYVHPTMEMKRRDMQKLSALMEAGPGAGRRRRQPAPGV